MTDTSTISDLQSVCSDIREMLQRPIRNLESYHWNGSTSQQTLEFVKRAAVIRQMEACSAILTLVGTGVASTSVSMLRTAYEELIWIEYLNKNPKYATEIVTLLTQKEIFDSYDAQKKFLGQRVIRDLGFTKRLSRSIERFESESSKKLSEIGKVLQWRKGSSRPSAAFVSRKVGRESQYGFLYHGTSRYVHFSPHELQRRVWGQHGKVSVSSNNFESYWRDFVLSWSFRMLIETIVAGGYADRIIEQEGWDQDQFLQLLGDLRPVQILTASELEAWDEPKATNLMGN